MTTVKFPGPRKRGPVGRGLDYTSCSPTRTWAVNISSSFEMTLISPRRQWLWEWDEVNGSQRAECQLSDGMRIEVGTTVLLVKLHRSTRSQRNCRPGERRGADARHDLALDILPGGSNLRR